MLQLWKNTITKLVAALFFLLTETAGQVNVSKVTAPACDPLSTVGLKKDKHSPAVVFTVAAAGSFSRAGAVQSRHARLLFTAVQPISMHKTAD